MAITKTARAAFAVTRLWNRTLGQYFKFDMYGVMIFGVRFTRKKIADKLNELSGNDFTPEQKRDFTIRQVGNFYMFTRRA